jgi:hypothetical protein
VPDYATAPETALTTPVLADLGLHLGPNMDPLAGWTSNPAGMNTAAKNYCSQRWWSTTLGTKLHHWLVDHASPRDQARLLEQRSGVGNSWMAALPSAGSGAIFSSEEYCLGLHWWLGVPLLAPSDEEALCPGCEAVVDPAGDHFLCCPRINFAQRHDAVQDAIITVLSSSGQSVAREVALQSSADTHLRPADILIGNWHGGLPTALDVTVAHGWSAAAASSTAPVARDNWRPFLRRREVAKHDKYDEPCRKEGWHFAAAAFGTWGGMGPEGAKILSRIVKRATAWEDAEAQGAAQRRLYEGIGVALTRHIWRLLGAKNNVS